jgi:hypothetical protein
MYTNLAFFLGCLTPSIKEDNKPGRTSSLHSTTTSIFEIFLIPRYFNGNFYLFYDEATPAYPIAREKRS